MLTDEELTTVSFHLVRVIVLRQYTLPPIFLRIVVEETERRVRGEPARSVGRLIDDAIAVFEAQLRRMDTSQTA